jgi:type I protein arginine methyltransferase
MLIEFHRAMLADRVRNEAFYQALAQVIRPGETVLGDVGSGTGLLAFMARQLGAKACYLYEYTDALKLSQRLARANRIQGCHFVQQHSAKVRNPAKVDLLVSETLGNFALEENIIETIEDAKRFLKPGGLIIPGRLEQFVAPLTSDRFYRELVVWDQVGYGLDFGLAKEMGLNNLYVRTLRGDDLLAADSERRWDALDFAQSNRSIRQGQVEWRLEQATTIYGFGLWWRCELVPGVSLSTSPFANLTHWEQLYAPVLEPLEAAPGDRLSLKLESDSRYEVGVNLRWQARLQRRDGSREEQQMDMRKGYME